MNAQKYFEQHTEELIASFAGKNAVLFFRGFVPANVRWLAQRENAILPLNKVLNADGTISIAKIDAAKRKLVQSLMMQEEGVTVGIYEEMLAILQNVQDPKAMFDAEFIVVDNNAFPAYVPSCIPAEDAEVLYKAYETEKTEFGPEAEVLSHYYAAVRMLMIAATLPRSTAIRVRTSAASTFTRRSRRPLQMLQRPCPVTFRRWCWQTVSSAARWKIRWCCRWRESRTPRITPTMCWRLRQSSAA